jgi:hypothetical protein
MEHWREILDFPGYSVSNYGRIRTDKTGRVLVTYENQFGLLQVGMMQNGIQCHRSVPLLVAYTFIPQPSEAFDTPINLDGDRHNNHVDNLLWRPRWFAVRYNRQFRGPQLNHISTPIVNIQTGDISENSFECAKRYGLLEEDLILSIATRTYVWPLYQEFGVLND